MMEQHFVNVYADFMERLFANTLASVQIAFLKAPRKHRVIRVPPVPKSFVCVLDISAVTMELLSHCTRRKQIDRTLGSKRIGCLYHGTVWNICGYRVNAPTCRSNLNTLMDGGVKVPCKTFFTSSQLIDVPGAERNFAYKIPI